jgi:hypothetical protein
MPNYTVHVISYEALIKGSTRIVLPEGANPRDYEHLLANHEIYWNHHTIHSREITHTEAERTVDGEASLSGAAAAFVARHLPDDTPYPLALGEDIVPAEAPPEEVPF